MISLLVREKLYISEVVLGTAFGILMGPLVANIFDPRSWGTDSNVITLEVMRVVLATGLFAIGIELPQSYLAEHAKGLLVLVIPTMAFGWLVVAGIMDALFPHLDFISCLVIAACLTPTDPVICATIVGGKYAVKHVPVNLRRILAAESAANDGLAYPFLSISIYLTIEASRGAAFSKWFVVGWLYQVILGTVIGAVMGLAFSRLMKYTHKKGYIDRESYVAQYLALAIFTIGIVRTLGSDDLLAAFAAGSAISWDGHFNDQVEGEVFASVIDLVLNCACFIYIGAWIPFHTFNSAHLFVSPWQLVVLVITILLLRRIPFVLLLHFWVPEITNWQEALFCGHFGGPEFIHLSMGVGAIFVSTLALTRLPEPQSPPQSQAELLAAVLHPIVSFVVLCSIIIHGLSIPFFSFSRKATRSLSISATLASGNVPEWLVSARRAPTSDNIVKRGSTPLHTGTSPAADIEAGSTAAPTHPQLSSHNVNRVSVDGEVCVHLFFWVISESLTFLEADVGTYVQEGPIIGGEASGNVDGKAVRFPSDE
ncbi:hypothetical protein PLEOSDRAFT_1036575 [Pleurotus ostreatus PC15]|uniref:Cation/H+ exchanger transmembrane domain-containing protein n=1 Tax=Pleurotus ostreatus (strain PC15) TaxID=1137138 RepID=A0A067NQS3_PLEO1|nr:hypothetical protein PLEOSDRAFT_1036575 [Pleurotus ostreatus PC15]